MPAFAGMTEKLIPHPFVLFRRLVLQQRPDYLNFALAGGKDGAAGQIERRVLLVAARHPFEPGLVDSHSKCNT